MHLDNIDDKELMVAFQQQDERAFNELVKRYSAKIVNFFYRLCWNRHTCEDLAQEVMVKLYRGVANYEPRGSFPAYIYQIARNVWIDHIRRHKKHPLFLSNEENTSLVESIHSPQFSPSEELEYQEKMAQIKAAISGLSEELHVIFILYEQGLKYSDIAEIAEIPIGTVKSRLHKVFCILRELLAEDS